MRFPGSVFGTSYGIDLRTIPLGGHGICIGYSSVINIVFSNKIAVGLKSYSFEKEGNFSTDGLEKMNLLQW